MITPVRLYLVTNAGHHKNGRHMIKFLFLLVLHTLLYLADVYWMPLRRKLRYALTGHFIVMLNYLDIEKSYYYVEKSAFF